MKGYVLTVERVVPASPEAIFALVADASRHPDIDGSGTVVRAKPDAPERLGLGATFGMSMKMGVPYAMVNTVIEFEENRRIAWQAVPPGPSRHIAGGRIWRYELEPVEGGTMVRESWDLSQDKQRPILRVVMAGGTRRNMERTLERIAELTAPA
jgi:hypothetical protein